MISHFGVKNYKILSDIDIPLSPIHVLIGQNDSGKTSLLEAIHSFCRSTRPGLTIKEAFESRWQGRELVFFGAKESVVDFSSRVEGIWEGQNLDQGYGFRVAFNPLVAQECKIVSEWCS